MPRSIFEIEEFPDLIPLFKCWQGIWSELASTDLTWIHWGAEDETLVSGEWVAAPVYTGNTTGKGRKRKPRPRGIHHPSSERQFLHACRELPKILPEMTKWFKTFERVNMIGLSRFLPGCELDTHIHQNPDSLVLHICCMAPPQGAALAVGPTLCSAPWMGYSISSEDIVFEWSEPGEYIIFDDSLPHAAWNRGETERILLHIDFEKEL